MNRISTFVRLLCLAMILALVSGPAFGATKHKRRRTAKTSVRAKKTRKAPRIVHAVSLTGPAPIIRGGPWFAPTYADSTAGDHVDGEDLDVRRAAVEALGPYNGSVVVVDPNTGRILSMVNQKLALSSGFQPCSTVKVSVALAALREKIITPLQKVRLYGKYGTNLTQALARSNNLYFGSLGVKLGYDKFAHYAHLFGYGEKAGWNIEGEHEGAFPDGPPRNGGMAMLTSFGEEISQTPLQLAGLMTALANGGTLYYLQYPMSQAEAQHLTPRVKRQLEIREFIPDLKPGLLGAVEFGTARRASQDQPIAGKTGTCSDQHTHLGWFGSYNDVGQNKLVVVVLLTGGRPAIGPAAAGVAGEVYRRLAQRNYFAGTKPITPAALISTQICCAVK